MLFPRNALASWPQDCLLAEKGIIKGIIKEGKRGKRLDRVILVATIVPVFAY